MEKIIAELKEKRDYHIEELEDLHRYEPEPSEEYYKLRKNELEYQIACLEMAIDELINQSSLKKNQSKRLMATVLLLAIVSSIIYLLLN
tara:strand:- start:629 stop:895 length:267 start_codon:yes stop_codon:yes gene_type:complete